MAKKCWCETSKNGVCEICIKPYSKCDCGASKSILEKIKNCECSFMEKEKSPICQGCCVHHKEGCLCYF